MLDKLSWGPCGRSWMMTLLFPNKRRNKIRIRKNIGGWEILNIRGGGKLSETVAHTGVSDQIRLTDCSLC